VHVTRLELLWIAAALFFLYEPSGPAAVWTLTGLGWFVFGGAWRWQMYPFALTTLPLVSALLMQHDDEFFTRGLIGPIIRVVLGIGLVLSFVLCAFLPLQRLPEPSGPLKETVRSTALVARDEARCMATVAYPARTQWRDRMRARYFRLGYEQASGLAWYLRHKTMGINVVPSFLFNFMTHTETNMWEEPYATHDERALYRVGAKDLRDDPTAANRLRKRLVGETPGLPLVILSHGLAGCPALYTTLTQELTSEGFIVIAPEHHDGSCCFTALPPKFRSRTYYTHVDDIEGVPGNPDLFYSVRRG